MNRQRRDGRTNHRVIRGGSVITPSNSTDKAAETLHPEKTPDAFRARTEKANIHIEIERNNVQDNDAKIFQVGFMSYIEPDDTEDLDETKKVDKQNDERYAFNEKHLPKIQVLLKRMKLSEKWKLPKPPAYHKRAMEIWEAKIEQTDYKNLLAVEWLAKHNSPWYPVKDYPVKDAGDKADKLALEDFLFKVNERVRKGQLIDISKISPPNHLVNCSCKTKWDGISKTCKGGKLRLCWITNEDHHFLHPSIQPSCI